MELRAFRLPRRDSGAARFPAPAPEPASARGLSGPPVSGRGPAGVGRQEMPRLFGSGAATISV
ncbi:hypothetical protein GCM10010361_66820 [Streptomyces olivaceiscleroticus]|uniref:Uncharacterized protein n=1 Tax=Streptomyces olivaceiscleroticus TaxID=68245 RepID=A0ABP3L2R8_9ACTN